MKMVLNSKYQLSQGASVKSFKKLKGEKMKNPSFVINIIKDKMKEVWSAGDFGVIAKIIESEGNAFINRLHIAPDSKVLDVACGTGNLSLPAAKLGARVTGLDLVSDLIRQANERAQTENLNIKFDVGDAEALPYGNNEFDYVVTMFGAMFCPRPEVAVSELLRVCKPGGTIAMANWTPEGFIGKFFRLGASYLPTPPGIPSPLSWGVETTVKERFGSNASELDISRRVFQQSIPMRPNEATDHFIKYFGPTKKIYETLEIESRLNFRTDLLKLFHDNNVSGNEHVVIDSEYLEVIAAKK
jgi:ubiquinone/menaquinone biosynthesis C-methylase UbiE